MTVEGGSGIPTDTGILLPHLTRAGEVVNQSRAHYFILPGDDNQEYVTNNAVKVWRRMRCYRFQCYKNPGVGHLEFTQDSVVIDQLLTDLRQPQSRCPVRSEPADIADR
jgi:lecithin-cholesterol acyltransferase